MSPSLFPSSSPSWYSKKLLAPDGAGSDSFGISIAASASTIYVGATKDDDSGSNTGSVYLYSMDGSFINKIIAPDAATTGAGAEFGKSISVSTTELVIGAHFHLENGSQAGAAYIFTTSGTFVAKLLAPDGASADRFGGSVAVDGSAVLVSAYNDDNMGTNSGAAYHFTTSGDFVRKYWPSDGSSSDWFGYSLAITGTTFVISSYGDDDVGSFSGKVYLYSMDGPLIKNIYASDASAGASFGYSVAASSSAIVVGAPNHDELGSDAGAAYIFTASGTFVAKLLAHDGASGDLFGIAVAVSDTMAVIGAKWDDDNGGGSGSAYVYSLSGSFIQKLVSDDGAADDNSGSAVAATDNTAIIGCAFDDDNGSNSGSAYIYRVPVPSPSPSTSSQPSSVPSSSPSMNTINVATGGTASQVCNWSSTSHLASEAIDGDTDGVFSNGSIANTCSVTNAWWQVDLGNVYRIVDIIVWNRTDDHTQRLSDSDVLIIANDGSTEMDSKYIGDSTNVASFPFNYGNGVLGRYVKVQLRGTNQFGLAEVEVIGSSSNVARSGTASHSCERIGDPAPAQRANDGNTDGNFANGSMSHTYEENADAWWQVDLGRMHKIETIIVWNRTDCCTFRLSNSDVQVLADDGVAIIDSKTIGDSTNIASFTFNYSSSGSVEGRYVKVKTNTINYLALAEVEVYGIAI